MFFLVIQNQARIHSLPSIHHKNVLCTRKTDNSAFPSVFCKRSVKGRANIEQKCAAGDDKCVRLSPAMREGSPSGGLPLLNDECATFTRDCRLVDLATVCHLFQQLALLTLSFRQLMVALHVGRNCN